MSARIAGEGGAKALRLGGRQFDLERVRHTLGDFSLKLRGLRERTLVTLRPEPRPGRRLDQLQINRNRIGCSLKASAPARAAPPAGRQISFSGCGKSLLSRASA